MAARDHVTLSAMVKGGDWAFGCQLNDPKHFYRSYTTQELDRIMTARPTTTAGVRARAMNLFRRYFDLVSAGRKTIEVRVRYPNLRRLRPGDHIRFVCGRDDLPHSRQTGHRVRLLRGNAGRGGAGQRQPRQPREQQLTNIRRIYGPEKEALGVLAIEIELAGPADGA